MPAKESGKRELEILLNGVELSTSAFGNGACKRMVTVELIWPRMQVASKSSLKLLSFAKGLSVPTGWIKRILFKESVEHRFGIVVRVTETVKATAVRKFFRSMAGTLLGIAGDFADDAMPNKYAGDAVSAPFDYTATAHPRASRQRLGCRKAMTRTQAMTSATVRLPAQLSTSSFLKILHYPTRRRPRSLRNQQELAFSMQTPSRRLSTTFLDGMP